MMDFSELRMTLSRKHRRCWRRTWA